jgi:predicted nucleotide-binding protein (sugar kinase/HSP70/actin superfamily)
MYYDYLPLWIRYFENLGADIIISSKTNKEIINDGVKYAVDEACLPVKLFFGHVAQLRGQCDYIFLPRLMSVKEGEHHCPQFGGLPELIRYSIKDLPPLIDKEINCNKNDLIVSAYEIGWVLTHNKRKLKRAFEKASMEYMMEIAEKQIRNQRKGWQNGLKTGDNKKILVLGHAYNLYDEFVNMDLLKKLKKWKVDCMLPETVSDYYISKYTQEDMICWTQYKTLAGSAKYLLKQRAVQGVIYISSFGCGLDSVIINTIERVARTEGIPFLLLTIDEHTADAGINTRVEAFVDMINWRESNEGIVSTYGECLHSF